MTRFLRRLMASLFGDRRPGALRAPADRRRQRAEAGARLEEARRRLKETIPPPEE